MKIAYRLVELPYLGPMKYGQAREVLEPRKDIQKPQPQIAVAS